MPRRNTDNGEPAGPLGGGQRAEEGCDDRSGMSKQAPQQKEGPRLERMWGVKSLTIPVVMGAFGAVTSPCWVSGSSRSSEIPDEALGTKLHRSL